MRKLLEEYNKWGLTVNIEISMYWYKKKIELEQDKEIMPCRVYKYLGVILV